MTIINQKSILGVFSFFVAMLIVFPVTAQMKTPSPLDQAKTPPTGEEGDDYYDEEQAGGIHYEDQEVQVLDKETIRKVIDGRNKSIAYCYEKELQTTRKLKGRVVVNLTIQLDGVVKGVKVVKDKSTLKNKKVRNCIIDIMKSLRFPVRKTGEPIEINYPFVFKPKEGGK